MHHQLVARPAAHGVVIARRQRAEHIGVDDDGLDLGCCIIAEVMSVNVRINDVLDQVGFADTADSDQ